MAICQHNSYCPIGRWFVFSIIVEQKLSYALVKDTSRKKPRKINPYGTAMVFLVDMDNVLADFDGHLLSLYQQHHQNKGQLFAYNQRSYFYFWQNYQPQAKAHIEALYYQKGFYYHLPPMPGALPGIKKLNAMGHQVVIVSTPLLSPWCALEKHQWVLKHLGAEWASRLVLCHDKTLIKGDVLIDDKPNISGEAQPSWKQWYYKQPYNKNCPGPHFTWADADGLLANIFS